MYYNADVNGTDVIQLYKLFQENEIDIWIDGGWGVDALLEKQIRPHKDLDIAIQEKDYQDVSALCEKFGIPLPEEYKKF